MKILNIRSSEVDFAAMTAEDSYGIDKIYQEMLEEGVTSKVFEGDSVGQDQDEYYHFEARLIEFGDVDPSFVEFVREQQDYDASKDENFYVVEK